MKEFHNYEIETFFPKQLFTLMNKPHKFALHATSYALTQNHPFYVKTVLK